MSFAFFIKGATSELQENYQQLDFALAALFWQRLRVALPALCAGDEIRPG
jgi:hypothetical protein